MEMRGPRMEMTDAEKLDAHISEMILEYPDALIEFGFDDGYICVLYYNDFLVKSDFDPE